MLFQFLVSYRVLAVSNKVQSSSASSAEFKSSLQDMLLNIHALINMVARVSIPDLEAVNRTPTIMMLSAIIGVLMLESFLPAFL